MELVEEFTLQVSLNPPIDMGAGPFGTRLYFEATGGRVTGERLSGELVAGGGDWLLVGPDGLGRLDVRIQLRTDDGAAIYITYAGILELNEPVQQAMAGQREGTDFTDQYFRTTPRFETGDPSYAWLTQHVFVAEGRVWPPFGVEYRIYRVN